MNVQQVLLPGGGHAARFDPTAYISEQGVVAGLASNAGRQDPAAIRTNVGRIAESFRAMKRDQAGLPQAWLPAGEWAAYPGSKDALYGALLDNRIDDAAETLRDFWRNSLGLIVKEYATFEAMSEPQGEQRTRFLHNVVRNWLIWRELTSSPTMELATPAVGNPWGYAIEGTVVAPKACRYHLFARELSGMLAGHSRPTLVEIGGGYGGLAEFLMRRVPEVAWIDYDLPETAVIAAYFHLGARGSGNVVLYGEGSPPRSRADLAPGKSYVMPNYAIRELVAGSADAVVNMFSLSEVGAEPLAAYLERIRSVAAEWFVHHNMDRAGVINRGHERIPSSSFAAQLPELPLIATGFDPFHGLDGDYRWFIHRCART